MKRPPTPAMHFDTKTAEVPQSAVLPEMQPSAQPVPQPDAQPGNLPLSCQLNGQLSSQLRIQLCRRLVQRVVIFAQRGTLEKVMVAALVIPSLGASARVC